MFERVPVLLSVDDELLRVAELLRVDVPDERVVLVVPDVRTRVVVVLLGSACAWRELVPVALRVVVPVLLRVVVPVLLRVVVPLLLRVVVPELVDEVRVVCVVRELSAVVCGVDVVRDEVVAVC